MRSAGWGRILNVGGLAARQPGSISAGARNTAIVHLTASMAAELGRSGVNVNAVHPGLTETESFRDKISNWASDFGMDVGQLEGRMTQQISIGRFVTADEVAAVVTFLVSPLAVAVNGEVIAVGGGSTQAVYY
jgi:NAD(P)-dependent dehydrogenase (short-subunit alcohol dehydrogenase family)